MKCTVYHSMKCAKKRESTWISWAKKEERIFVYRRKEKIKMKFKIYLMLLKISQKIKTIIRSWTLKKKQFESLRSDLILEKEKKQWSWRWWWNSWNKKLLVYVWLLFIDSGLSFYFLGKQSSVSNVAFYSREVYSSEKTKDNREKRIKKIAQKVIDEAVGMVQNKMRLIKRAR